MPAASANATKKSFGLELQEPRKAAAGAADSTTTSGSSDAAAAGGSSTEGKLKSRKFPWLGMPEDTDWIL